MSKIDEIINFLTNDLNIKISNKKRDLIINRFYPDFKDKNIGLSVLMKDVQIFL